MMAIGFFKLSKLSRGDGYTPLLWPFHFKKGNLSEAQVSNYQKAQKVGLWGGGIFFFSILIPLIILFGTGWYDHKTNESLNSAVVIDQPTLVVFTYPDSVNAFGEAAAERYRIGYKDAINTANSSGLKLEFTKNRQKLIQVGVDTFWTPTFSWGYCLAAPGLEPIYINGMELDEDFGQLINDYLNGL